MRWIILAVAALILLPILWQLLKFAIGAAFGVLHLVVVLLVILFLVGLVRRLLLMR